VANCDIRRPASLKMLKELISLCDTTKMYVFRVRQVTDPPIMLNPLNTELKPNCHLLALLGANHILHVGRVRVNNTTQ